jgi:site-specific DNA recombinase
MLKQQQNMAAIYCRLSRDDGGDAESNSIGNQRSMLQRYAKENGFIAYQEYIDDGISGTTFERPSFKQMIVDIESGKVGVVLCKDLSRLGRNNAIVAYYTEIFFPDNDIRFIAVNDSIDTFVGNNEIMGFKSIINEYYARDISKKLRSSYRTLALNGQFVGGQAPYGYMKSPENSHQLIIDDETAPNVLRMFQMAADGISPSEIMRTFSEEKILTPRAYTAQRTGKYQSAINQDFPTDWSKVTVVSILKNREYLGHLVANKQTSKSFKNKKKVTRPDAEWIETPNTHEAIVDEQTFEKVQRLITIKRRKCISEFDNIFQGLLRCSTCGVHLCYQNIQGRHQNGSFCCNHYRRYTSHCTAHYIGYTVLYDIVLKNIQEMAALAKTHEDDISGLVEKLLDGGADTSGRKLRRELDKGQQRVSELDAIIKKMLEQNARGFISDERFAVLSAEYEAEQKTLTTSLDDMRAKLLKQESDSDGAVRFLSVIRKYTEIEELTMPILNELIDKIVIYDGEGRGANRTQQVDIHYHFVGLLSKKE